MQHCVFYIDILVSTRLLAKSNTRRLIALSCLCADYEATASIYLISEDCQVVTLFFTFAQSQASCLPVFPVFLQSKANLCPLKLLLTTALYVASLNKIVSNGRVTEFKSHLSVPGLATCCTCICFHSLYLDYRATLNINVLVCVCVCVSFTIL